ncbi:MAG: SDR family NAD(P)-dependent oxidoreductase, partial [Desulfosudaceae bacterium]
RTLGEICGHLVSLSGGAAAAAAPTAAPAGAGVDAGRIEQAMLDIVSRVTGYPQEMLTLEMDIENDLGIDSIKRVEILSVFEEENPEIPSAEPEDLAEMRTLGEICGHLVSLSGGAAGPSGESVSEPAAASAEAGAAPVEQKIPRRTLGLTPAPPLSGPCLELEDDKRILVCGGSSVLGPAIAEALSQAGLLAEWRAETPPADEDLAALGGLVLVPELPDRGEGQWTTEDETAVKDLFDLVIRAAPALTTPGAPGKYRLLAAVTRLDGSLGLSGRGSFNPVPAALHGAVKTAAIEWENVICRCIDVAPDWTDPAAAVAAELADPGGPLEIGLDAASRQTVALSEGACPAGTLNLGPDDVVVVTGGARGVTAQCARTLARASGAAFVLLGRSPLPEPEPAWLADVVSEADMKKRIMENEFAGLQVTPADLEKSFQRYRAAREISATMDDLGAVCREVAYYPVDVRDAAAVAGVFGRIRESLGEITCLIHGAGVLVDRFIADKTREQVDRVFDTKVAGARALLQAVPAGSLKYLVFFSSVTARMGNRGQVDYAMANEVLNKAAQKLSHDWPQCRVLAMNWGPWDGGMVTPSLKREFARNGVALIPLEEGSQCLLAEMAAAESARVEVVVGAGFGDMAAADTASGTESRDSSARPVPGLSDNGYTTAFEREISLEAFPVLHSHVLNEKPVVPFALAAEWIGSGALHANPGLRLTGLDEMRMLAGIKLNGASAGIAVMTEKARKKGAFFEVGVQIRSGRAGGEPLLHYAATALLAGSFDDPPAYTEPEPLARANYSRPVEEVYEKILFHGSDLYGIREITGCCAEGIKARVSCAPPPAQWIAQPIRNAWLSDPLVLDAAFQLAIVWSYENTGTRCLPVGLARFRQFRPAFPAEGVTVILEVRERTKHKLRGDFIFLDPEGVVVARMEGYEAVQAAL